MHQLRSAIAAEHSDMGRVKGMEIAGVNEFLGERRRIIALT